VPHGTGRAGEPDDRQAPLRPAPSRVAHLFGAHTVDTGGIDMAVRRADAAGMDALQIFTAIPKFYGDKSGIRPERAERFREALAASRIEPRNVIAHGAYLLGVATSDEAKWKRAAGGLAKEMERSTELGLGGVCFHPGTAGEGDGNAAAKRVARAMTAALEGVEGGPRLLVENTAGAGRTYGRTPEEVGAILDAIPDRLRERTGYGLDTAHLFASGYDLRERQVFDSRAGCVRGSDRGGARLLPSQRQRGRGGLEQGPARPHRRGGDRGRALRLAACRPAQPATSPSSWRLPARTTTSPPTMPRPMTTMSGC
jgi:endonuclease IV